MFHKSKQHDCQPTESHTQPIIITYLVLKLTTVCASCTDTVFIVILKSYGSLHQHKYDQIRTIHCKQNRPVRWSSTHKTKMYNISKILNKNNIVADSRTMPYFNRLK